jgi:hypothetical protein
VSFDTSNQVQASLTLAINHRKIDIFAELGDFCGPFEVSSLDLLEQRIGISSRLLAFPLAGVHAVAHVEPPSVATPGIPQSREFVVRTLQNC